MYFKPIFRTFLTVVFLLFVNATFAQPPINTTLAKQLKQMYKEDQQWRKELVKLQQGNVSDYNKETIEQNMGRADSINYLQAKSILNQYGFPGYKLVGEDGSDRFWAIVQHCDNDLQFQEQVLKLMYPEVKHNNATAEDYALLKDRILVSKHQKQIYGTQLKYNPATKRSTPFPIANEAHVDHRRKAMGMVPLKNYLHEINHTPLLPLM